MSDYRYCVRGEIDIASAPTMRADLQEVISSKSCHLLVDCTFLTFIDSSGIAVLLEARRDLEARDRQMLMVNVPAGPRRALEICGLGALLRYDREVAS